MVTYQERKHGRTDRVRKEQLTKLDEWKRTHHHHPSNTLGASLDTRHPLLSVALMAHGGFWNIGAAPTLDIPVALFLGEDPFMGFMDAFGAHAETETALLSPGTPSTPTLHRFGSIGGAPTFSAAERTKREQRAQLERQAVTAFAMEVCAIHIPTSNGGRPNTQMLPERFDQSQLTSSEAIATKHTTRFRNACDLAARASPGQATNGEWFDAACNTYFGKYIGHREAMLKVLPADRIALRSCVPKQRDMNGMEIEVPEGYEDPNEWWYEPDYDGVGYVMRGDLGVYGRGLDIDATSATMVSEMAEAVKLSARMWNMLHDRGVFRQQGADGRFRNHVNNTEEAREAVQVATQCEPGRMPPPPGVAIQQQFCTDMRHLLVARFKAVARSRAAYRSINHQVKLMQEERAARYGKVSLFMETFVTIDHLKPIIEDLGPSDASTLLVVLRCARLTDYDILSLLRSRLPRLHIHIAPGMFPHEIKTGGEGYVYADTQLQVAVSFVTSRLRQRIREDHLLTDDLTQEKYIVPEKDYGTATDPGYITQEGTIMALAADRTDPKASQRRIKHNGWTDVVTRTSDELQLRTADPLKYFEKAPRVGFMLVHADTGEPVVPDTLYGGLEPEKWLKATGGRMRLCEDRRTDAARYSSRWSNWHMPSDYEHERRQCRAILARFWPKCLSSVNDGGKFKIVVRCTGVAKGSSPPREITLVSESAAVTFVSNKRVGASGVGTRKPKRKEPAP